MKTITSRFEGLCKLLCLLMLFAIGPLYAQVAPNFEESLQSLNAKSFKDKETAIQAFQNFPDERVLPVLQAMLDGRLYYRKEDKKIVFAERADGGYQLTDALNDEDLGQVGRRDAKKISINNSLRRVLRAAIARLQLSHQNSETRRQAALSMLQNPSAESLEVMNERLAQEQDSDVLDIMHTILAINALENPETQARLEAAKALSGNLHPEVHVALLKRLGEADAPVEPDPEVLKAIEDAIDSIDRKRLFYKQVENLLFGMSLGSVLLLAAVGLAITFGVMGVINMAHGEMIMIGAYTTYVVQQIMPNFISASILLSIPMAFVVAGLIGIVIERGIIRHLYGRPLETLLATFGLSLVLQQLVRTIFSPLNRSVISPDWMSGTMAINPVLSFTYNRMFVIAFSLLVLIALMLLLKRTRFGLQVRAVTQNRPMAQAMGVRTERVDALTFGLGSGIAGIAGVALSQLTNVGPNMGQSYIIDSFMVVVFGGVGNLLGTFFAAMTLGVANKFIEPFAGAVLAKILILVFIILFIQKRPRGMFAIKGRAADS